jgi:hypothetical protein
MNFADVMEMLRNPQAMQARAEELRRKTEAIEVIGSAGGGMVRVTINGAMTVKGLVIAPEAMDPADIGMLQDLVVAAVNQAVTRMREVSKEKMSSLMGGMNIPGMPGMF